MKKILFITITLGFILISNLQADIVRRAVLGDYIDYDVPTKTIRCKPTANVCYWIDQIVLGPGQNPAPGGAECGLWIPSAGKGITNVKTVDESSTYDPIYGTIIIHTPELTQYSSELNGTDYLQWLEQFED
jgi:hypothetical protein